MHAYLLRLAATSTMSFALLFALTGCSKGPDDVLGQAYVAPATLNLRGELNQKNTVAMLKHGERVSIIDVRRRFVRVRTSSGQEGWIDSLQLLSEEQMDQLRRDTRNALAMPPEGSASVYEALNIHINPSRHSPAFARIPEGGSVAVLAHQIQARTSGPPRPPALIVDRPQPLSHRTKKDRHSRNSDRLPPRPPAPKPPANWQELSAERIDGAESVADVKTRKEKQAAEQKAAELKKPVIMEDWSLVRTKSNECGWVLSRNLVMSIPDEVAQYAEGKRISSYFDLGSVQDEVKGLKHNWLWTTSSRVQPYDFDAWRVFLWNRRRHRYETSFRQRDVEGYFPVQVDSPDSNAFGRTFKLITKDDDGKFRQRAYLFDGVRVHLSGTKEYDPGKAQIASKPGVADEQKLHVKAKRQSWFGRQWSALKRRVLGGD
jgi:uncharacterized protein YgiM (DUF1202 family)